MVSLLLCAEGNSLLQLTIVYICIHVHATLFMRHNSSWIEVQMLLYKIQLDNLNLIMSHKVSNMYIYNM